MTKPTIDATTTFTPPEAPRLEGPFAPNTTLETVELWPVPGEGPEDVTFDGDGRAYCGVEDGRILAFEPDGTGPETVATVPGRPLGIEADPRGGLVVCSATEGGLLHVDPDSAEVTTIVEAVQGRRMLFCNNAAITADGARIYFTDSSQRFGFEGTMAAMFEQSGTGRLLVHDRDTGETTVLRDGLFFANGVTLAPDESFLLFAETQRYRITRWWLQGRAAGTYEPFVENLPGLPDNLSTGPDGVFWVPLVNPRDQVLDRLLPRPWLRNLIWRLPEAVHPPPTRYGFVLGYDADGRVVHNLQGPSGNAYARITTAEEHDGHLYLGSLDEHALARVEVPG